MRPLLFVVCFSLGVSLMVFSGYLPNSASAGDSSRSEPAVDASMGPVAAPYYRSGPRPNPLPAPQKVAVPTAAPLPETSQQPVTATPAIEASTTPDPLPVTEAGVQAAAENAAEKLREVEASLAEEEEPSEGDAPIAEAGDDRIVWIGWDEIVLDGKGSTKGMAYAWRQVAGSPPLEITRPDRMTTEARGLPVGPDMGWKPRLYAFELKVTDDAGRAAVDEVEVVVLSGPELSLRPRAARSFKVRDGYLLAHYESWATASGAYETTFTIRSPNELTFTPVAGGAYELSGRRVGRRYVYEVKVYQEESLATSWLEFLVDTDEKIPGIVQLGVSWE
jgi:hypothetical protein